MTLDFSLFVSEQSFISSDCLEKMKRKEIFSWSLEPWIWRSKLPALWEWITMFSLKQNSFQSTTGMLRVGCMLPWERISNSAHIHISHIGTRVPYLALCVFRSLCSVRKLHFSLSADCFVVYDPPQAAVENAFSSSQWESTTCCYCLQQIDYHDYAS